MPKCDLLVYLSTPIETCAERIQTRGLRGRLKNRNSQEVRQFIENSSRALRLGVDFLSSQGLRIIEIENSGDIETAISFLEKALGELVNDK